MGEIYFKDSNSVTYTDDDLKIIVIDKNVPDFAKQTLIQDEIPYSNQKVTYGRKRENRIITLSIVFDTSSYTELYSMIDALDSIMRSTFDIGFTDEGYEYNCNLVGDIEQKEIKKHIRKYTFTFETTTPDRTPIT